MSDLESFSIEEIDLIIALGCHQDGLPVTLPIFMNIGQIIVWIIVGGFAGTLAGRVVTWKKEGLGRWANLLVGVIGAVIGGELFRLFKIDFGLGELKVTFEDLIAAFLGSLLVIFAWRIVARLKAKNAKNQPPKRQP